MHRILLIAKEDYRKLSLNAISILVCIGLICIPSVYAWFNIGGSWDPYGNTENVTIGVINQDEGYSNDYLPIDISIGDEVIGMLVNNSSFQWEFMDKDEALKELNEAQIYAAIEIPADFSKNIMSVLTSETESAELIYYNDEKMNALAPKITSKGVDTIQKKVNTVFSEQVLNSLFKTAIRIVDITKSESVISLVNKLSTSFGDASLSLKGAATQMQSLKDLTGTLQELLDKINAITSSGDSSSIDEMQSVIEEISSSCSEAKDIVDQIITFLEDIGVSEQGTQTLRDLSSLLTQLKSLVESTQIIANDVAQNFSALKNTLTQVTNLINSINTQLDKMYNDFTVLSGDMQNAKDAIDGLDSNTTLDKLEQIIGSNPRGLAKLISYPVQINRTAIYPIANNGSSMSAFFISLSIWVGATILLAIMKAEVSPKRIRKLNEKLKKEAESKNKKFKPIKERHLFFGRYIIFGLMAIAQATLICLGAIFFLGIQCVHPILFLITAWLVAIFFSLLVYTLTVCFGNIGKAMAVILLVLQVAASGGMFPNEMICWPFNLIYPYLPLSYSIDAFHYCIADFSYYEPFIIWVVMFFYIVPVCLIMGLALRKVFKKGSKWFNEKIHESYLIS